MSAYPEDSCRFQHLGHESRDTLQLAVASAYTAEDRVEDRDAGRRARHEAPSLSHERNHTNLADIRAFPAHVGSGFGISLAAIDTLADGATY